MKWFWELLVGWSLAFSWLCSPWVVSHADAQSVSPVQVVDLMVVHTPQASYGAGNAAELATQIRAAVMEANLVLQNSRINTRIRLVHTAEVDYQDSGSIANDLTRLRLPYDGYLDQVHAWRDLYGADLVCLVVEQGNDYSFYGLQGPSAVNAFSVIRRAGLTGQWFLPVTLSFNFGCQLERRYADSAAAFPYAYGYSFPAAGYTYSTVEAFSGYRLPCFSNPNLYFLPLVPLGIPAGVAGAADNARVIKQTTPLVSAFRGSAQTTLPPSIYIVDPPNSTIELPAHSSLSLLVSASDSDGAVSHVDLFRFDPANQVTTLVSSAVDPPYGFLLTNLPAGQWQFIAEAIDDSGAASCTPGVFVTVNNYPPSNDNFAARLILSGTDLRVPTDNRLATAERDETNHAGLPVNHSAWWTWTAPVTGNFVAQTEASTFRTVLAVYQGVTLSNLTEVATSAASPEALICFRAVQGETYQIALDGYYGASGDTILRIFQTVSPRNDDFAAREVLLGTNITLESTNTFATREEVEPEHLPDNAQVSRSSHRTLWWTWTALGDGELDLNTVGSGFNPVLAIYTGNSLASLTSVIKSYAPNQPAQESRLNVVAGTVYQVAVDGAGSDGRLQLHLTFTPRPVNDDFAGRIALTGSQLTISASNRGANKEVGEPLHGGAAGGRSVWWTWTAPSDGTLAMNTFGSSFYPYLALYVGETLTTLQPVIANQNPFMFTITAGTTYQIAVDGWDSQPGDIVFHLDFRAAPPNDSFAARLPLIGQEATASGSLSGASKEPGERVMTGSHDGASVWWSWTAPASGYTTVSAQTDFYLSMGVYSGSVLSNLTTIGEFRPAWNRAASVTFFAIKGSNYNFAVNGNYGESGNLTLSLQEVVYPDNDNFENRLPLSGSAWMTTNTNVRATSQPGEPPHAGQAADRSLWWSWTAPETRDVILVGTGPGFVPRISVYTGSVLGELVRLVDGTNGTVRFRGLAGTTYQLALDGSSDALGNVVLELVSAPDNDDFAMRTSVQGTNLVLGGSTRAASLQPGEPVRHPYQSGTSVWWSWTAPQDGEVVVQMAGGDITPVIGIYTGSSLTELSAVFTGYIGGPGTAFFAKGGVTYLIAVDGPEGKVGTYAIRWRQSTPPINDHFASRIPAAGTHALLSGSTSSASVEPAEPGWSFFQSHHTSWWSWTAPTNGNVTIFFGGTNADATLAVFTGNSLSTLTRVASKDYNGPLTFAAIVRIPGQIGQRFRFQFGHRIQFKSDSDSGANRTGIPMQTGQ